MSDALSVLERSELESCEKLIQDNLPQFELVGRALLVIRNKKLYRTAYRRFEDYLRDRWSMTRVHAHRLIIESEMAESLPEGAKPANERQARELAKVPASDRPGVMAEVKGGGKTTAAAIAQIAAIFQKARVNNPCPADPQDERRRQIKSLVARLKNLHAGIPEVADRCDRILGEYLEALEAA